MPNIFDVTSLTVIDRVDAQIALDPMTPTSFEMGTRATVNFTYIGGTNHPAHAFRLRAYPTEALRSSDAELDEGRGVIRGGIAPRNVIFGPPTPDPGPGFDHELLSLIHISEPTRPY